MPSRHAMIKISAITRQDLPEGCPRPIEYRDHPLPECRVHTWVCCPATAAVVQSLLWSTGIAFETRAV